MKHWGRVALSITLGLVMTLGMCPKQGIAETIDVESDEDEVVIDADSEEGFEKDEPQPEEQAVTIESLESQDEEPVAIVQWYEGPTGTDSFGEKSYAVIDEAIKYWKERYPAAVLLLQGQRLTVPESYNPRYDGNRAISFNGSFKALDLDGAEMDMDNLPIYVTNSSGITVVLRDSSDQLNGKLSNVTISVGSHNTFRSILLMEGGTLENSGSANAPCVQVQRRSRDSAYQHFTLRAGTITNQSGAGIAMSKNGRCIMSGGTIEGCASGGVNMDATCVFEVSGNPIISGNTKDGQTQNVFLTDGAFITVAGALTDGARIGVTTATKPTVGNPVVFTSGFKAFNEGVDPAKFFTSDDDAFYVSSSSDGEAVLKVREHNWSYAANDNVLRATCTDQGCPVGDQTLTLSVADKTYDGKTATATITASSGWTLDNELAVVPDVSDVTYYQNGTVLAAAPSNVGDYTAELVVPGTGQDQGAMVRTSFRIRKAPLTVTAQNKTIAFGEAPTNSGVTYAGFVNGENASVLSGALVYDYGGYKANMSAGAYAITPSGLASGNYAIAYKAGTLTVKPQVMPEPNPPKPLPDPIILPKTVSVREVAHVQNKGTMKAVTGVGKVIGTTGRSLRLESLRLSLRGKPISGGIEYCAYVQGAGWQGWRANGGMAGTQGKARRVEAIRIALTGKMGQQYDVYYRVHVQNYGWMAWTKNGARAGTRGKRLRVEAVQIVVMRKGVSAPSRTYKGVVQTYNKAFVKKSTLRRSVGR